MGSTKITKDRIETLSKLDILGLENIDNTSDLNKNVLSALKLTNPVTINEVSFDGSSNITTFDEYYILPKSFDLSTISSLASKKIIINFNFDLLGQTITLPNNVELIFNGGSFTNGTITGLNYNIIASKENIFKNGSIILSGTPINDFYPEWWGDRSISNYDWQPAIQQALNAARLNSGKVQLSAYEYKYYNELSVYDGEALIGVSKGNTAFGNASTKGTVLHCLGNSLGSTLNENTAIKVYGKMVTMRDFTLKGERSLSKYGNGIVIYGVGDGSSNQSLIENCHFENILIHGFMKGKGLNLVAGNSGAVTYCNFYNIRIRDCAKHLYIEALSSNPIYNNLGSNGLPYTNVNCFINSNNFDGLYISGYCETGIGVITQKDTNQINSQDVFRPANNITFSGVVIEPPYSNNSHIRLEGAGSSVRMSNVRIEALSQDANYPSVPVIYLGEGVNNCLIDLDQASVPIQDFGFNNRIQSHNSKNAIPTNDSHNFYKNSALIGLDKNSPNVYLPEWTLEEQGVGVSDTYAWRVLQSNSNVQIDYSNYTHEIGYKTLKITVPPNYQFRMYQSIDRNLNKISTGRVNAIVKTANLKDVIWTYQDSVTPILSGGTTFGGNIYEPIGGFFNITPPTLSTYYRIALFCQNNTSNNIIFEITMPSFVTGEINPRHPAKLISENGGTLYGVLGFNVVKNIKPLTNPNHRDSGASDVVLPKEGNFYEFNEGGFSIQKINANINRFEKGSVITLRFNYAGITIINSSFITLNKPYVSEVGSTITLQSSNGDGLWQEVNRYSKKITGLQNSEISSLINASNYLELDTTCNIFTLSNSNNLDNLINRINYNNRFDPGSEITLIFSNTNGKITINNNSYISLYKSVQYTPNDGDWITLRSIGDGTWFEVSRKQNSAIFKIGYSVIEAGNYISTNFLTLPLTGENYFVLNNTTGTPLTINRINYNNRFESGQSITLRFDTLTSNISLANSTYLNLSGGNSFTPNVGDWIVLIHQNDGTWIETARKQSQTYPLDQSITLSSATLSNNFLTLPVNGGNYFKLSCATTGGSIQRINNTVGTRFGGGRLLFLEFSNITVAPTLVHSGYINLNGSTNYSPALNGGIVLYTRGDGTWRELSRF